MSAARPGLDTTTARQLAEAATPGPWIPEWSGGSEGNGEWWSSLEVGFNDPVEPTAGLMMGDHENADADAKFIAAARSLVPALCDELDAARAELVKERAANSAITAANRVLGARLAGYENPPAVLPSTP